eukprot:257541-Chlamydomonas_euryale.AAC.1
MKSLTPQPCHANAISVPRNADLRRRGRKASRRCHRRTSRCHHNQFAKKCTSEETREEGKAQVPLSDKRRCHHAQFAKKCTVPIKPNNPGLHTQPT